MGLTGITHALLVNPRTDRATAKRSLTLPRYGAPRLRANSPTASIVASEFLSLSIRSPPLSWRFFRKLHIPSNLIDVQTSPFAASFIAYRTRRLASTVFVLAPPSFGGSSSSIFLFATERRIPRCEEDAPPRGAHWWKTKGLGTNFATPDHFVTRAAVGQGR